MSKTTTTTREYDDEGRLVKETTVEVEWPEPYRDSGRWWQPNPLPWWQNPIISYAQTTPNTGAPVIVNSVT